MNVSKIHSTLAFTANNGDEFKYEVHQSLNNASYFAVIYALQDIETMKYGRCCTWVQINAYLSLDAVNPFSCEEECKAHFLTHHQNFIGVS